jgi:hypothetical protein
MTEAMLLLARDWKEGRLHPVHPTIGQLLNQALARAGEDVVPHRTHTNRLARTLEDLIRNEYERGGSRGGIN